MLMIKYKKPTHTDENGKQYFLTCNVPWSEKKEAEIKEKGYEYSIVEKEDKPKPAAPTLEERVGTLETDTADLAEALDMILSGVVE